MKTTEVLFSFKGRISRRQYGKKGILPLATGWALFILFVLLLVILRPVSEPIAPVAAILFFVMYIALAIFSAVAGLAVYTKRLHDLGRSGWWNLLLFIPFVGPLINLALMIILGAKRGQLEGNRYGPVPGPDQNG